VSQWSEVAWFDLFLILKINYDVEKFLYVIENTSSKWRHKFFSFLSPSLSKILVAFLTTILVIEQYRFVSSLSETHYVIFDGLGANQTFWRILFKIPFDFSVELWETNTCVLIRGSLEDRFERFRLEWDERTDVVVFISPLINQLAPFIPQPISVGLFQRQLHL